MSEAVLFSGKELSHLVDYNALINSKQVSNIKKSSQDRLEQVFCDIGGIPKEGRTIEEFISHIDESMKVDINTDDKNMVNDNLIMHSPKH